ncbi:MAG TPA: WYL domain-containing protein [Rhizomicrobium sp.]|jgi:predicted DNA-binding transcriptional regulator YafY
MLASRLLSTLMLLQTRGRLSASALAREFEVSVRTIHRDIDQLSAAGIPVYADRGRSGGFALMDGYRTRLTGLTQPEAEAILLAGLPGPAAQLGLSPFLSAARLKLLAALPANLQADAERIASRFHLDPVAWFRGADTLPSLPTLARAVWTGHFLKLGYRRAGQTETRSRKLGPLGLVLKGGVWYLVAQSGKSVRTYRAANIHDAEIGEEIFARPKQFDLAAYWEKSSKAYEASLYCERAMVRLSTRGMQRIEALGPTIANAAYDTAGKPDRRGWVRCTLPIEPGENGMRDLLRLGDEVEVIGPPAQREQMANLLASMSRRHRRR